MPRHGRGRGARGAGPRWSEHARARDGPGGPRLGETTAHDTDARPSDADSDAHVDTTRRTARCHAWLTVPTPGRAHRGRPGGGEQQDREVGTSRAARPRAYHERVRLLRTVRLLLASPRVPTARRTQSSAWTKWGSTAEAGGASTVRVPTLWITIDFIGEREREREGEREREKERERESARERERERERKRERERERERARARASERERFHLRKCVASASLSFPRVTRTTSRHLLHPADTQLSQPHTLLDDSRTGAFVPDTAHILCRSVQPMGPCGASWRTHRMPCENSAALHAVARLTNSKSYLSCTGSAASEGSTPRMSITSSTPSSAGGTASVSRTPR